MNRFTTCSDELAEVIRANAIRVDATLHNAIEPKNPDCSDSSPSEMSRSKDATTAAASSGFPLWKVMPSWIGTSHVTSSTWVGNSAASEGTNSPLASRANSVS